MDMFLEQILIDYQLPSVFLGSLFFGESFIIAASFLAGQDLWSVSSVTALSFIGTITSDSIWFLLGSVAECAFELIFSFFESEFLKNYAA